MSEATIELEAAPSEQPPVEAYSAQTLAALAEEEQLSDQAEQAVAVLLLTLLLQGAAPAVAAQSPVSAAALRHVLAPVLYPFVIGVGFTLLSRSRRRDTSDWNPMVNRIIDEAADLAADMVTRESGRQAGKDMYKRDHDGPANVDVWARQMANMIVTAVREGMKRGLSNRLGFSYKRWLTRLDNRVRDTHQALEGVTIHKNAKFRTQSGAKLELPGDRSAPLGEWINCRCRVLWLRGSET